MSQHRSGGSVKAPREMGEASQGAFHRNPVPIHSLGREQGLRQMCPSAVSTHVTPPGHLISAFRKALGGINRMTAHEAFC